jgi:hypothetical protein
MVRVMAEPPITREAAYGVRPGNLPIKHVVIHDEEYPVGDTSAESVAAFFAGATARGSAHYVEDADSEQHCVAEDHIAAHAPPNTGRSVSSRTATPTSPSRTGRNRAARPRSGEPQRASLTSATGTTYQSGG